MSHLSLIWRSPDFSHLSSLLAETLFQFYPETLDNIYIIARSLEEFIKQLIISHPGISNIDNELYWTRPINELKINIPIRSGQESIFPDLFLESENLNKADPILIENLCLIIVNEIEHNLQIRVKTSINENYAQKNFSIYIDEKIEMLDNFEKNQLGIFLYILYLKRLFSNDKNVCVITSELEPLFKRCRDLEQDIASMSKSQFLSKNPQYENRYDHLIKVYKNSKIYFFRIALLVTLIDLSGPYIIGTQENFKFKIEPTKSFRILFDRCKKSGSRFSVSFVTIFSKGDEEKSEGHATILIIDNVEKVIERFDPNGTGVSVDLKYINDFTDDALGKFAKSEGYMYAAPETFCPRLGIQHIEHLFSGETGYCVSWSILYAEERLVSSKSRSYIAQNLLEDIIDKYNLRSSNREQTALNVEEWMRKRINIIFSDMSSVYKELSSYLDIPVNYIEGKLIYHV